MRHKRTNIPNRNPPPRTLPDCPFSRAPCTPSEFRCGGAARGSFEVRLGSSQHTESIRCDTTPHPPCWEPEIYKRWYLLFAPVGTQTFGTGGGGGISVRFVCTDVHVLLMGPREGGGPGRASGWLGGSNLNRTPTDRLPPRTSPDHPSSRATRTPSISRCGGASR